MSQYVLKLFISGKSPQSMAAIDNLRTFCERELKGKYALEIIDVTEDPSAAERQQVLATPALIRELPPPLRRIIGDLSDHERVLVGLEILRPAKAEGDGRPSPGSPTCGVPKLPTGIPGFDLIAQGGLPRGRTTLVAGTAGSAKTVFAAQFVAAGIMHFDEPGVFVTFEETPADIRENLLAFGWDLQRWEDEGKWAFVDASPIPGDHVTEVGRYDLGGLLARLEHAVRKVGAVRVSLDSLGAILSQFTDRATVRNEMFRITRALREAGVTSVVTAEREREYGEVARFGVEEFVVDNAVLLRNVLDDEKRRRTMEILKFRGTSHQKGEWPFSIVPGQGIVGIPLSAIELKQRSSDVRITSGVAELDRMCGGGFFQDSIILVSGATGTGKTLLATHFVGSDDADSRTLLFAFEESHDQLFRNAAGWGIDFPQLERQDRLRVVCKYPEVANLEDHLIQIKEAIDEYRPTRVAVDSLSALHRIASTKTFREFVLGLTSFLKDCEIAGFFTATTPNLLGGPSTTEAHVSTITDSIILLRYVEVYGEMRRGLTVLKMRGSHHDKDIREFFIDNRGMHVGKTFQNVSGILKGEPTLVSPHVVERVGSMFHDPPADHGGAGFGSPSFDHPSR